MTPQGKAHCVVRLTSCPDIAALRRVWGNLAVAYQSDPELIELKDRLKAEFEGDTAI